MKKSTKEFLEKMQKTIDNLNKDFSKYVHPLVKQKMLEKRGELK